MDRSSSFLHLQKYDLELFQKITSSEWPLDVKIENMEDGTIGFAAAFQYNNKYIEFYTMNAVKSY